MDRKLIYASARFRCGKCIFLSLIAVILGGAIYIFLRPSEHVFFQWFRAIGLENWLSIARRNPCLIHPFFPGWFIYSLPNALWAFAYALIISALWTRNTSWLKYFWLATIPLLVLGYEILQYPGIIPGTFCLQDIVLGTAGLMIGIILGLKAQKSSYHEKAR